MRPPFGNRVLQRYLKIPVWIIRLAVSAVTHYAILLKHCAHRRKTEEVHVKMEEELEQSATPRGLAEAKEEQGRACRDSDPQALLIPDFWPSGLCEDKSLWF